MYLFPGFFGSQLYLDQRLTDLLWVSYADLAAGNLGTARLAPDGISPGAPDGQQLYHGAPLDDYYGPALVALSEALAGTGYTFHQFGYDWRLSLLSQPLPAVADILANVTAEDPCTIVAHSYGGLIARRTWAAVVAAGGQNLIRRVVTLGTPHYGTYTPLTVWANDYPFIGQLCLLAAVAPLLVSPVIGPFYRTMKEPAQIIALSCTWPALYDCLPIPGAPDAAHDPLRPALYDSANYVGAPVSQSWLTEALTMAQPWLLSPGSMPPPWILTTIAGTGIDTVDQLRVAKPLANPGGYNRSSNGDGVVSLASALGPAQFSYIVSQRHNDLPLATARSGLLAQAILENRPSPPPPPAVNTVPDVTRPVLAGPPVPDLSYAVQGLQLGGTGGCCGKC